MEALLRKYFPFLTAEQIARYEKLTPLYEYWNARINVISRKDMDHFAERHVLHALGIASVVQFAPGTKVLDVGTGGGFPGIPLAIMFPETHFTLVDSIGKKIKVVNEVVRETGLSNVTALHARAEETRGKFHFVVSRAVTEFSEFYKWVSGKFLTESVNKIPNGILALKGGDLTDELKDFAGRIKIYDLKNHFTGEFFETKKVVYCRIKS